MMASTSYALKPLRKWDRLHVATACSHPSNVDWRSCRLQATSSRTRAGWLLMASITPSPYRSQSAPAERASAPRMQWVRNEQKVLESLYQGSQLLTRNWRPYRGWRPHAPLTRRDTPNVTP